MIKLLMRLQLSEANQKKHFFFILKTATLKLRCLLGIYHIRFHTSTTVIII